MQFDSAASLSEGRTNEAIDWTTNFSIGSTGTGPTSCGPGWTA
jgi:hypothetical protein